MLSMTISPYQLDKDYVTKPEFEDFQIGLEEKFCFIDRRFTEARQFTKDAFYGLEKYVDIRFDSIDDKLGSLEEKIDGITNLLTKNK